jgi:hypothetical protein
MKTRRSATHHPVNRLRPRLEALECRELMSAAIPIPLPARPPALAPSAFRGLLPPAHLPLTPPWDLRTLPGLDVTRPPPSPRPIPVPGDPSPEAWLMPPAPAPSAFPGVLPPTHLPLTPPWDLRILPGLDVTRPPPSPRPIPVPGDPSPEARLLPYNSWSESRPVFLPELGLIVRPV